MNYISITDTNYLIKGYLYAENFDQHKTWELNNLIDNNLRMILQQTETPQSKDLQANLLALSNKINKEINTPQAHELSFNIMGLALGLFSTEKNNYLQDEIPSDVFSVILNNLNPDNLASDIQFLTSIERTSTLWRQEIHTHILRRINVENLSPSIIGCKTGSEAIEYIIKNKLQSANLSDFFDITDDDLKKLIENCPNLHTLFVHSNKIKEIPFEKLQALQRLDLAWCKQLSEDKLPEALAKLTALKSLVLRGCWQLSGDKLAETLGKLQALQGLDLSDCTQLSEDILIEALGKLTALQSLDLSWCKQLSGDKLAEALGKLQALKSLDFAWCTQLSEDTLIVALGKLTALQSLNLAGCTQLSGDKLAKELGKLTALKRLTIARFKGDKLAEALDKFKAQGVGIYFQYFQ